MTRVLLTGFEPFDGAEVNESWEAVRMAADAWSDPGIELVTARLPVAFVEAPAAVLALAGERGPLDAVINVGLDARTKEIAIERLAANIADARIPDNLGAQPGDEPLTEGGPAGIWATLPTREIQKALADAEIPARLSYSAGAYVCNATFYRVAEALSGTGTRVGFIHVPPAAAMPLEETARALSTVVKKAVSAD